MYWSALVGCPFTVVVSMCIILWYLFCFVRSSLFIIVAIVFVCVFCMDWSVFVGCPFTVVCVCIFCDISLYVRCFFNGYCFYCYCFCFLYVFPFARLWKYILICCFYIILYYCWLLLMLFVLLLCVLFDLVYVFFLSAKQSRFCNGSFVILLCVSVILFFMSKFIQATSSTKISLFFVVLIHRTLLQTYLGGEGGDG